MEQLQDVKKALLNKAQSLQETIDDARANETAISKEDLIKALNKVFETHDIDTARGVLQKFGVAKVGELKPKQFAQFIDACAGAVNS